MIVCKVFGNCRMSSASCAARYTRAQHRGHPLALSACRTCDEGRERAGLARPHLSIAAPRPPSLYTEVERVGRMVLVECKCGKRTRVRRWMWDGKDRPAGCQPCVARRPLVRAWNLRQYGEAQA